MGDTLAAAVAAGGCGTPLSGSRSVVREVLEHDDPDMFTPRGSSAPPETADTSWALDSPALASLAKA